MKTSYGSVLPSSLFGGSELRKIGSFNKLYSNFGLKVGVVTEIIDVDDKKNFSKLFTEYNVAVIEQTQDVGYAIEIYKNCLSVDKFGGQADFFEAKYRKPSKNDAKNDQLLSGNDGSIVLVQCIDGYADKALIVGGLGHAKRKKKLKKSDGHALLMEFNGLGLSVDKTGAMSVVFSGATDNTGKPLKKEVGGSFIKFLSDGTVEISDAKGESIRLDKTANEVSIKSSKNMIIEVGGDKSEKIGGNMNVEISGELVLKASGSTNYETGSLTAQVQGEVKIQAKGFDINAGPKFEVTASQMAFIGQVALGSQGGSPAITGITKFIGVGNLGAPVVSTAIGPFSSKVRIT